MAQKVYELMLEECIGWSNYHGTFDKQEVFGSKRFKWMQQIVGCYRLVGEKGSLEKQAPSTRQECKLVVFSVVLQVVETRNNYQWFLKFHGWPSQHCLFVKDPSLCWGLVTFLCQVRIYTQWGEGGMGDMGGGDSQVNIVCLQKTLLPLGVWWARWEFIPREGREGGEGPQITCQFLLTVSHIL